MKSQACEPCAKRKVRCDREEPCRNCKRRKQDRCTYPETSPQDRIKALEALVRNLGGNPDNDVQHASDSSEPNRPSASTQIRSPKATHETPSRVAWGSKDSVMLEEDGKSFYLESRAWQTWLGSNQDDGVQRDKTTRHPLLARDHPSALQAMFRSPTSTNLAAQYPSQEEATTLWEYFNHRVYPLVRISFSWALRQLHSDSVHLERRNRFTDAEHAFMFSLYLVSVASLSDEECKKELKQPRSALLSKFETLCQEALLRTNIFCIADVIVLKALVLYMMAGIDRVSTHSLWSLMGLMSRNAEKLGVHRDGALLGLPPAETEDRRRLWWQMQHLDLALAIRSGSTPITLMADWDAKLPLNIEDEDINTTMTAFPKERKGLTSISYNRWTYWVLDQQRHFLRPEQEKFALSWQASTTLPLLLKDSLINHLEDGLNQNFLQYCDPIKPLDTLIQLSARSMICGMRQRAVSPLAHGGDVEYESEEHHDALLSACIKSLEYDIAQHSQPSIKHFQWWTQGFFPWHALMCVLVELSRETDRSKTQQIWDLLSGLYSANLSLSQLSEDRRRSHAARLVVTAWKARQKRSESKQSIQKPEFLIQLERRLSEYRAGLVSHPNSDEVREAGQGQHVEPFTPESFLTERDMDDIFGLDFQDIDWSFWSSVD